jgi:PAS domain S-box-containing protein
MSSAHHLKFGPAEPLAANGETPSAASEAALASLRTEEALLRSIDAERARAAELEALMDSVPAAIWIARDPACGLITGNNAAYRLFRAEPGSNLSLSAPPGERPDHFDFFADGRQLEPDARPLRRAGRGEFVRDCALELRFADGTTRHLLVNATPLRDAHGKLTGGVASFIDVTERKRLADAQEHLASIVETSDDAIISKDTNGVILSWNKSAERLFGYKPEEIIGKNVTTIIPGHLLDQEPQILERIRRGERIDHFETVRRRKDGTLVDISLTVSPIRNARGQIVAASKIARDISEKKKAEAQHDLLMAELSHRVKNTLATVISIARQSFSGPETREARAAFNARIRGLAHSHARLAEGNWTSVELRSLFEDEFAPYRRGVNVQLSGPSVALSPKAALTLGLAVHELATNAAKYGALSSDSGIVDVSWTIDPNDDALAIAWQERGGPSVVPPTRTGFGRLLLERAVASDLKARVALAFEPEGFRFSAVIPSAQYRARPE